MLSNLHTFSLTISCNIEKLPVAPFAAKVRCWPLDTCGCTNVKFLSFFQVALMRETPVFTLK